MDARIAFGAGVAGEASRCGACKPQACFGCFADGAALKAQGLRDFGFVWGSGPGAYVEVASALAKAKKGRMLASFRWGEFAGARFTDFGTGKGESYHPEI